MINGRDHPSLPNKRNVKLIGLLMPPSVEYIVYILSILRVGAAFLSLDPHWPTERITSTLFSSNVDLLVVWGGRSGPHLTDNHLPHCPVITVGVELLSDRGCLSFDLAWPCECRSEGREFSYLMYTSGSTGKPRGVCGSEDGVFNRFLWMQESFPLRKNEDVLLFKTSVSFVDHIQEFLGPVLAGCTLVIPAFDELRGNVFGLVDYVCEYGITRLTVVPSLIRAVLPALEGLYSKGVESSLKMLVVSGEVFSVSLWKAVSRVLPCTTILNVYGSTEVAADCTYFDCRRLPGILESEMLSSVPIGVPILNCDVRIVGDEGKEDEGEICVSGVCVAAGYYSEGDVVSLNCIRLEDDSDSTGELYYRTGDFARRLPSGDLMFLGRKDRTVKVNGQRIALEEVEDTLRGHPEIADVAVVFCSKEDEHAFLGAAVVLKDGSQSSDVVGSLKSWMVERLPSAMTPREIVCVVAIPMTSSGKVDYTLLRSSIFRGHSLNEGCVRSCKTLEHIKEAFCEALDVAEVANSDDFFALGGDSLLAAHVAHKLGIDMRVLYMFPSPSRLLKAITEKEDTLETGYQIKWETLPNAQNYGTSDFGSSGKRSKELFIHSDKHGSSKHLKLDAGRYLKPSATKSNSFPSWESLSKPAEWSLGRCNKMMHRIDIEPHKLFPETLKIELPKDTEGTLRELWRVPMESCVDASPLVVFKNENILAFIGSHSHKFVCVNARNGLVLWEIKLEGRIESSAIVDGDFSQVIVGCYGGNIYFIDILKGIVNWTFQTGGEVKSQPAVDKCRNLVWCGSHDHCLYGLDYRNHCLVYKFPCGGTVFGSPAIDERREILYVGTTNGRLIAITLKDSSFSSLWLLELEAPIFGSLSLSTIGNIVCCLVNGDVLSVNREGTIVWRSKTDGPIFAGPSISTTLGSQALVCSRNGRVFSFDSETGCLKWEYNVGDPITSSAYVDDHVEVVSDSFSPPRRLVCVCSSSGRVTLLLVSCITYEADTAKDADHAVRKFAEIDVKGDIFSSPVMVAGRIFVGCRDDYLHCLMTEAHLESD
ncbi:hypothetical protein vseg_013981 [Gypsophila vaccaria]